MDNSEEELTRLNDDLADARTEIEGLRTALADREATALHVESQLSELREEVATAQQGIAARNEEIASLRTQAETLGSAVRDSAARYRALILEREPELPVDLVGGDSIEEVDQAVERARETVAKVRGHLESQAQSNRVPAGAPVRPAEDLATLSAGEKIARGIESLRD